MPTELIAYFISVISAAIAVYALWELHEAKTNGKKWIELSQELKSRLDQLERKR